MSELDLDAIEARAKDATEGPWIPFDMAKETGEGEGWWWVWREKALPNYGGVLEVEDLGEPHGSVGGAQITDGDDPEQELKDAEFIAHARQDIPALIAEVRRLRARPTQQELADTLMSAWHRGIDLEDNPEFGGTRTDVMVDAVLGLFPEVPKDSNG